MVIGHNTEHEELDFVKKKKIVNRKIPEQSTDLFFKLNKNIFYLIEFTFICIFLFKFPGTL